MTVLEVVKKYQLEDFDKNYVTQYGNFCNLTPLDKLSNMQVKSININFPTNDVTITVIQNTLTESDSNDVVKTVIYKEFGIFKNNYRR